MPSSKTIGQRLFDLFKIVLCSFGVVTTFYMVIELTYFLSVPDYEKLERKSRDPWLKTSWALLTNTALVSLFILQHSLLASLKIKDAFEVYGMKMIYRSLYVITTAGILLFLMRHWQTTPDTILWQLNLHYKPLWWVYAGIHFLSWVIIYIGNICTDVTELLGIKQVYYSVFNLPDPNLRKSAQLKRLTSHMRHPSFLAFLLIFWLYPVMSLDRLLLANILTMYMYIAWNTDERDYNYHKYQYERKHFELESLHGY
ncbi:unnamed protein product [Acanthoscelides obtectus]|uniref:Nuclear envelope membrane protein n=1 Tax=Acanthoscelides obtectus TaxID=200917 RepID=A0A9P0LSH1_ACAOB|nr:unnamed protein product [Acanthoscelides obtectus]CAK1638431.1 Nurim homolog [Acanthoscelides obtectus]